MLQAEHQFLSILARGPAGQDHRQHVTFEKSNLIYAPLKIHAGLY